MHITREGERNLQSTLYTVDAAKEYFRESRGDYATPKEWGDHLNEELNQRIGKQKEIQAELDQGVSDDRREVLVGELDGNQEEIKALKELLNELGWGTAHPTRNLIIIPAAVGLTGISAWSYRKYLSELIFPLII